MDIGTRILCVDDSIPAHLDMEIFKKEFPNWVKKDEKYTIRDIFYNDNIVTSIIVNELKNPILFFPGTINRSQEASFRITRFRELEEDEVEEEELQAVSRSQELNRKSRVIREAEKVFDDIINPAA